MKGFLAFIRAFQFPPKVADDTPPLVDLKVDWTCLTPRPPQVGRKSESSFGANFYILPRNSCVKINCPYK